MRSVGRIVLWSLALGLLFVIPLLEAWEGVAQERRGAVSVVALTGFASSLTISILLGRRLVTRKGSGGRSARIFSPAIAIGVGIALLLQDSTPERLIWGAAVALGVGVAATTLVVLSQPTGNEAGLGRRSGASTDTPPRPD